MDALNARRFTLTDNCRRLAGIADEVFQLTRESRENQLGTKPLDPLGASPELFTKTPIRSHLLER